MNKREICSDLMKTLDFLQGVLYGNKYGSLPCEGECAEEIERVKNVILQFVEKED